MQPAESDPQVTSSVAARGKFDGAATALSAFFGRTYGLCTPRGFPAAAKREVSTRNHLARLATLVACTLVPFASTSVTSALASCPNEQLRAESNVNPATGAPYSQELPSCRAYELVSPADTEGWSAPVEDEPGRVHGPLGQLIGPDGSVFYLSQARPPETGAIQEGRFFNVFRSRRSSVGWVTRDMTVLGTTATAHGVEFFDVAADGSAVLVATPTALSPEDIDNPIDNPTNGDDLYVLRENAPPEFVSHGETAVTAQDGPLTPGFGTIVANSDLSAVGFESAVGVRLDPSASTTARNCYVWRSQGDKLARITNADDPEDPGASNCEYLGMSHDGRAIVRDTSGDPDTGRIFVVGAHGGLELPESTQLSGDEGNATFDGLSPNGETAYITTPEKLTTEADADSGADLYAVSTTQGAIETTNGPAGVTCLSCGHSEGGADYVGMSADGSHVFYTADGALYANGPAGTQELASAADQLSEVKMSQNGQHVIAVTPVALSPTDSNGASDLYEFTAGEAPALITSGTGMAEYQPVAVSNTGRSVVFNADNVGSDSARTIDEWVDGAIGQISPVGALQGPYEALGVYGAELEDVFFVAHEPLVKQDFNGGTDDIYDARIDGGFPAPVEPTSNSQTPNPTAPDLAGYPSNLGTPDLQPVPLAPDTAAPTPAATRTGLTKAKQLAKAVAACKRYRRKSRRAACERRARKTYGSAKQGAAR
jgi:hypothetical protein